MIEERVTHRHPWGKHFLIQDDRGELSYQKPWVSFVR